LSKLWLLSTFEFFELEIFVILTPFFKFHIFRLHLNSLWPLLNTAYIILIQYSFSFPVNWTRPHSCPQMYDKISDSKNWLKLIFKYSQKYIIIILIIFFLLIKLHYKLMNIPDCCVCLVQFNSTNHIPHILPCGHTVCRFFINKAFNQ